MPKPYDLTTYNGKRVDWITRAALEDAERILDYAGPLPVSQGSYNAGGVAASAGTHDGGGAIDVVPADLGEARQLERVLRRLGFAAYVRPRLTRADGSLVWVLHVHAIMIGNRKLSAGASAQVREYLAGGDGLLGSAPDTGPREFTANRYRWQRGEVRIGRARVQIDKALAALAAYSADTGAGVRGYSVGAARAALRKAKAELPNPTTA